MPDLLTGLLSPPPPPVVLSLYVSGPVGGVCERSDVREALERALASADPTQRASIDRAFTRLRRALERRRSIDPAVVGFASGGSSGWVAIVPLPHAVRTRLLAADQPLVWPARAAWGTRPVPTALDRVERLVRSERAAAAEVPRAPGLRVNA